MKSKAQITTDVANERRLRERIPVSSPDIICRMASASEVTLIDMSAEGISLKADRRLEIDREYSLKLEYGDGSPLSFNGAVVWSVLAESSRKPHGALIYKAGMRLNGVPGTRLDEVIREICRNEPEARARGELRRKSVQRLNAGSCDGPPQADNLNIPAGFRIKRVNLNRIVVESERELNSGSALLLEIALPESRSFSFWGKVAFCLRSETYGMAGCYNAGIEFTGTPARNSLEEFIRLFEKEKKNFSFFASVR